MLSYSMKILYLTVAILAFLSTTDSITRKDIKPCLKTTDFRKLSHCISKRDTTCRKGSCNDCNNCNSGQGSCKESCNDCNSCDDNEPSSNRNTNSHTSSINDNNVHIQNKQSNENPHQNRIHVNLFNTVHNLNKMSNPIEVHNANHFFYDGKSSSKTNVQGGSTRIPTEIREAKNPCCGSSNCGIRPPMLLPPYLPPPPPCHYIPKMPFASCSTSPAPYIVPNCAPCFYCNGRYNPSLCSKQNTCKDECKKLNCVGGPCYPQILPCKNDTEIEIMKN